MQCNRQEELLRGLEVDLRGGWRPLCLYQRKNWADAAWFHTSASPPSASCPVQCYLRIGVPAHTVNRAPANTHKSFSHTFSKMIYNRKLFPQLRQSHFNNAWDIWEVIKLRGIKAQRQKWLSKTTHSTLHSACSAVNVTLDCCVGDLNPFLSEVEQSRPCSAKLLPLPVSAAQTTV